MTKHETPSKPHRPDDTGLIWPKKAKPQPPGVTAEESLRKRAERRKGLAWLR